MAEATQEDFDRLIEKAALETEIQKAAKDGWPDPKRRALAVIGKLRFPETLEVGTNGHS